VIEVRRAAERYRGGEPRAGIETLHAFSFGGHYDPGNVGFGLLLACNEERLAAGAGFAEHAHRDVEIVTWVLGGELTHRDGEGRDVRVGAGGLQRLSAGGGVRHVERNDGEVPLRFLQMWLHPAVFGGPPQYAVAADPASPGPGLTPVTAGTGGVAPRQPGAGLYLGRPAAADACALPEAPFRYLHVARGRVRLGGWTLGPGDAARIRDEPAVRVSTPGAAEYLVWAMRGEPSYG
jgi:redox-sensitive bicupin YhaK (pirin superfamily)